MFKIEDGREHFYQWDLDRRLVVEDASVSQVHFCNRTEDCSLVCETYTEDGLTLVNVPNVLLQTDWRIKVYAYDGKHTLYSSCYEVEARTKPADYVYTETEILNWQAMDEKLQKALADIEATKLKAEVAVEYANNAAANANEAAIYLSGEVNSAIGNANAAADYANSCGDYANGAADFAIQSVANMADRIVNTATGEAIKLTDSAEAPIEGLKVYGKTTQAAVPTPDNPQELESVGDTIEVNVYGKNLFDGVLEAGGIDSTTGTNTTNTTYVRTANYIPVKPNITYTITREETTKNIRTRFYDKDKNYISYGFSATTSPMTFTTKDNYAYLRLDLIGTNVNEKVQVELGAATGYEEYKPVQSFTVEAPNGLKGIPVTSGGNYIDSNGKQWFTDEIDLNKGVYIQRIGSINITGNENYSWIVSSCDTSRGCSADEKILQRTFKEIKKQGSLSNRLICTHYKASGSDTWYGLDNAVYITNQNIAFHHFGITTSDAFNEWLKSNPITIYFELPEPIETPITPEEIEAYTHYPATTVLTDKAGLEVSYKADTKNYIDNKFAELQSAVISMGGNI